MHHNFPEARQLVTASPCPHIFTGAPLSSFLGSHHPPRPTIPCRPAGRSDPRGRVCHQPHSAPGTSDCELPDPPASPAERERHTRAQLGLWDTLIGRMVDRKWCSPRKSSRTCRCPRSGISLVRGSCSLSCPASRKHPGPEEKQRKKQGNRIREGQRSLPAWRTAWRRQCRGTSLRDLPEPGLGKKTAETPEGSVHLI